METDQSLEDVCSGEVFSEGSEDGGGHSRRSSHDGNTEVQEEAKQLTGHLSTLAASFEESTGSGMENRALVRIEEEEEEDGVPDSTTKPTVSMQCLANTVKPVQLQVGNSLWGNSIQ